MFVDGELRDDLGTFDLAMMAVEEARNEVEKFSSEELGDIVKATRNGAVAHAKGKLKNAGQNQYSESAYSVTHAATTYAKDKIFNTDDSNYDEDKIKLKDINELRSDENITEEQLDRLTHQNTRKGDRFTEYMRGRADSFEEKFYELQLSGTPRTVKQATNQVQTEPASANPNYHFLAIADKPLLRPIEDSVSEASQLQQQNDLANIANMQHPPLRISFLQSTKKSNRGTPCRSIPPPKAQLVLLISALSRKKPLHAKWKTNPPNLNHQVS